MAQRTGPEAFLRIPCAATQMFLYLASWGCLGSGATRGLSGQEPQPLLPLGFSSHSDIISQLKNNSLYASSHLGPELAWWLPSALFLRGTAFPENNLGLDMVTRSVFCRVKDIKRKCQRKGLCEHVRVHTHTHRTSERAARHIVGLAL